MGVYGVWVSCDFSHGVGVFILAEGDEWGEQGFGDGVFLYGAVGIDAGERDISRCPYRSRFLGRGVDGIAWRGTVPEVDQRLKRLFNRWK